MGLERRARQWHLEVADLETNVQLALTVCWAHGSLLRHGIPNPVGEKQELKTVIITLKSMFSLLHLGASKRHLKIELRLDTIKGFPLESPFVLGHHPLSGP